jgi:hypothetical protein
MTNSRAISDVIRQTVCQTLNPLFVFLQEFVRRIKIFSNGYFFFSFLHIDIASRRSILPWPLGVIYLVETGFHGHVY